MAVAPTPQIFPSLSVYNKKGTLRIPTDLCLQAARHGQSTILRHYRTFIFPPVSEMLCLLRLPCFCYFSNVLVSHNSMDYEKKNQTLLYLDDTQHSDFLVSKFTIFFYFLSIWSKVKYSYVWNLKKWILFSMYFKHNPIFRLYEWSSNFSEEVELNFSKNENTYFHHGMHGCLYFLDFTLSMLSKIL
jgi:hypothetical protein